jgi:hypothetical protein
MTTRTPFASKSVPALQPAAYGWASLAAELGVVACSAAETPVIEGARAGGAVDGGKTVRSDAEEEAQPVIGRPYPHRHTPDDSPTTTGNQVKCSANLWLLYSLLPFLLYKVSGHP